MCFWKISICYEKMIPAKIVSVQSLRLYGNLVSAWCLVLDEAFILENQEKCAPGRKEQITSKIVSFAASVSNLLNKWNGSRFLKLLFYTKIGIIFEMSFSRKLSICQLVSLSSYAWMIFDHLSHAWISQTRAKMRKTEIKTDKF